MRAPDCGAVPEAALLVFVHGPGLVHVRRLHQRQLGHPPPDDREHPADNSFFIIGVRGKPQLKK